MYNQYRGALRKKKLEEQKADSPALTALRQRWPALLKEAALSCFLYTCAHATCVVGKRS
jgi:hypothetical protein